MAYKTFQYPIDYTTSYGKYARTYTATTGSGLNVELEKINPEYLGWCIFITRVGNDSESVYHNYAQTLAEAKAKARLFVESDIILSRAV